MPRQSIPHHPLPVMEEASGDDVVSRSPAEEQLKYNQSPRLPALSGAILTVTHCFGWLNLFVSQLSLLSF